MISALQVDRQVLQYVSPAESIMTVLMPWFSFLFKFSGVPIGRTGIVLVIYRPLLMKLLKETLKLSMADDTLLRQLTLGRG